MHRAWLAVALLRKVWVGHESDRRLKLSMGESESDRVVVNQEPVSTLRGTHHRLKEFAAVVDHSLLSMHRDELQKFLAILSDAIEKSPKVHKSECH